jgi:exosortase A-associated hydrolase 1
MTAHELPVVIPCGAEQMLGILHTPSNALPLGVVIIVGGPQYRVGSHRQFAIMARDFAEAGRVTLRFDCRGMGDSEGEFRGFENIGDDIRAAIDALYAEQRNLSGVILFGLCDAAAAAMFYAGNDPRVAGMVLANPWARTETGLARVHLRHYYTRRMLSREFWSKVFSGQFKLATSARALAATVQSAIWGARPAEPARGPVEKEGAQPKPGALSDVGLPDRMRRALEKFHGPTLFLLSGNDLTAREFEDASKGSRQWRRLMARPNCTIRRLPEADHTWSNRADLDDAIAMALDWIDRLDGAARASENAA